MEQLEQIEDDLKEAKSIYGSIDRIFLVNGDASVLKADYLKAIALKIKKYFPECKTITMYASIQNIKAKTDEELKELRGLGINDLYVGIESGVEEVVSHINKGHSVEEAKKQLARLNKFNITHMALLMLGVAGKGNGERNAKQTAKLLNETKPGLIWVGTLGVFEGTKMHEEVKEGNECEVFHLDSMNINGCKGCFGCNKNREYPCVQKDDMQKIYSSYRKADVVVLASPLYYWHLSGQLMIAINRLLAVMRTNKDYHIDKKESVLLMVAEGNEFELSVDYYNTLLSYIGWENKGIICVGGVKNPKDIDNNKKLNDAYNLGTSI